MSMLLMVQAMKCKIGNAARKLVLIKLADNANDNGVCFPSYQHIADQCEMSRRSAISHIDALINMGLVEKKLRKNKDGSSSNLYILHLENDGEKSAPPSEKFALGSENIAPPPSENISPITSHSFEPVNEPKKTTQKKFNAETAELPDFVDREVWVAYCQMRKAKRAEIKTEATLRLVLKDLTLHSGGDPTRATAVLQQSIAHTWTGIFSLKTSPLANSPSRKPDVHSGFAERVYGETKLPSWAMDIDETEGGNA